MFCVIDLFDGSGRLGLSARQRQRGTEIAEQFAGRLVGELAVGELVLRLGDHDLGLVDRPAVEEHQRLTQLVLRARRAEDAVVRAPFAGTIAKRHVQPGEKVSMDSNIVTLVDLRQMVLEAAVPAADIPAVRIGQPARFRVGGFGAREFTGEVQRINPVTADGSRAITLYIAVANPQRTLKGGMFAQGALTLEQSEPVLAVPQRAVHEEAGANYVYTDGHAEFLPWSKARRDQFPDHIVRKPLANPPE